MRFGVLGPVTVESDAGPLDIIRPRHRAVLTYLLLHANRLVPADQIIEAIWGGDAPSTARTQIQVAISAVRKALRPASADDRLVTEFAAYRLRARPDELDVAQFDQLVRQGRASAATDPGAAVGYLRTALALHRGIPLLGSVGAFVEPARADLNDRILSAWEQLVGIELRLGNHEAQVEQLTSLTLANPLRERLAEQLMLALYRCGRTSEALEWYRRLDGALRAELSITPSRRLRELRRAILVGEPADPTPSAPVAGVAQRVSATAPPSAAGQRISGSAVPVPRQLPAALSDFVGRTKPLQALDSLLAGGRPTRRLAAIVGTGGVGKTSLVIHWAHRVHQYFPDGQLYLDMAGYAATPPLSVAQALGRFLRALGLPVQQVPTDDDEAAALYRSLLSRRRVLVVLDNVRRDTRVDALVPGGDGCLTVLTSRDEPTWLTERLSLLRLTLEPLPMNEAVALLAGGLDGRDVAGTEIEALTRVAEACANVPLALRVAAAYLAERPRADLVQLGVRMAAVGVLGTVSRPDGTHPLLATFNLSYVDLSEPARRVFRLAGLAPTRDLTLPAAAALAGVAPPLAAGALDELSRAHLVYRQTGDRYAMHDLLREYAATRALGSDSATEQAAARQRLAEWYDAVATAAAGQLYPHLSRATDEPAPPPPATAPTGDAAAAEWLDDELDNLAAIAHHCATRGPHTRCLRLFDVLRMHLLARRDFLRSLELTGEALVLAERAGNLRAQAMYHLSLGLARDGLRQSERADEHLATAEALSRRAEFPAGVVAAATALGISCLHSGRLDLAAEQFERVARTARGPLAAAGSVGLCNRALVAYYQGDLATAVDHYRQAREVARELANRGLEAMAETGLGVTEAMLGRYASAARRLAAALAVHGAIGSRYGQVVALAGLSYVQSELGSHREAARLGQQALEAAERTTDAPLQAVALCALADAELAGGQAELALTRYEPANKLFRDTPLHPDRCRVLIGLARAYLAVEEPCEAVPVAAELLAVARSVGYRIVEGLALTLAAQLALADGAVPAAHDLLLRAAELHRSAGHYGGLTAAEHLLEGLPRPAG
jgi:DNA-binding SARP family transcriptional activator